MLTNPKTENLYESLTVLAKPRTPKLEIFNYKGALVKYGGSRKGEGKKKTLDPLPHLLKIEFFGI